MVKIKVPRGSSFRSFLQETAACSEAVDWVGNKSLRCAWNTCNRADWMLWLAEELGIAEQYTLPIVLDIYTATLTDKMLKHPIIREGFKLCRLWLKRNTMNSIGLGLESKNRREFIYDLIGDLDYIHTLAVDLVGITMCQSATIAINDLQAILCSLNGHVYLEEKNKIGANVVRGYITVRDKSLYLRVNKEVYTYL